MKQTWSLLLGCLCFSMYLQAQTKFQEVEYKNIKRLPNTSKHTDYCITANKDGDIIMLWRDIAENKLAYKRFAKAYDYTKAAPAKLSLRGEPHEALKLSNGYVMVGGTDYLVVTDSKFKCCNEGGTNKRGQSLNQFRASKYFTNSRAKIPTSEPTTNLTDVHFLEVAESPDGKYAFALCLTQYWASAREELEFKFQMAVYTAETDKISLHGLWSLTGFYDDYRDYATLGITKEQNAKGMLERKRRVEMEVLDDRYLLIGFYGGEYGKEYYKLYLYDYHALARPSETSYHGGAPDKMKEALSVISMSSSSVMTIGDEKKWGWGDFFVDNEIVYYLMASKIDDKEIRIGKLKREGDELAEVAFETSTIAKGTSGESTLLDLDEESFLIISRNDYDSGELSGMPKFTKINKKTLKEEGSYILKGQNKEDKDMYIGINVLDAVKVGDNELAVLFKNRIGSRHGTPPEKERQFILTHVKLGSK